MTAEPDRPAGRCRRHRHLRHRADLRDAPVATARTARERDQRVLQRQHQPAHLLPAACRATSRRRATRSSSISTSRRSAASPPRACCPSTPTAARSSSWVSTCRPTSRRSSAKTCCPPTACCRQDATLKVSLGQAAYVDVLIARDATNTTRANLITDINAAFTAAGLTGHHRVARREPPEAHPQRWLHRCVPERSRAERRDQHGRDRTQAQGDQHRGRLAHEKGVPARRAGDRQRDRDGGRRGRHRQFRLLRRRHPERHGLGQCDGRRAVPQERQQRDTDALHGPVRRSGQHSAVDQHRFHRHAQRERCRSP